MSASTLKAILFADAAQYSRHTMADEESTLSFMQICFSVMRELAPGHGGEVVKTLGDGAMVEFSSAVSALRYGLAVQARLGELAAQRSRERQIQFRIGIHLGDVQRREGDLYGHIVNLAARLEGLAEPGGICISQAMWEQVHNAVSAVYRGLGPRTLKNIAEPVVVYQVRAADASHEATKSNAWRKLSISVIERLSVATSAGDDLTPKSLKARALLGYLVLNPRSAEMRDRIAALLWSDLSSDKARRELAAAIRQIRQTFEKAGSDAFLLRLDSLKVTPSALNVDLLAISEQLTQGQISSDLVEGRITPDDILAGLDTADSVFAAWLKVTRHRWRERLVEQLEACLERFAVERLPARHAAIALLAIDPTHEQAASVLMRLYASEGKAAAALRVYRTLSDVLLREFGIDPSPEAQEIVAEIKAGRTASADQLTASPAAPAAFGGRLPVIEIRPFARAGSDASPDYRLSGFRAEVIGCLIKFRDWVIIEEQGEVVDAQKPGVIDYRVDALPHATGDQSIVITLTNLAGKGVVWSERFPIALDEWAVASSHVARRIAAVLDIYLSTERISKPHDSGDLSLAMYDQWLRGENLLTRWEPAAEAEAERLFKQVIVQMPSFAPAYASLASIYNVRHLIVAGFRRSPTLESEALKLAQAAIQLDPLDTRAHLTLAWSSAMAGRFEQADIHYDLAFELNPNNPKTLISCAHGFAYTGRIERAATLERLALELAPIIAPYQWGYIAGIRFICGDYTGSVVAGEKGAGSLMDIGLWKAAALAALGRLEEAQREVHKFLADVRGQWSTPAPDDKIILAWFLDGFPFKEQDALNKLKEYLSMTGVAVDS